MSERRKSRKEEIKKETADKLRENYKSVTAKIFEEPNYKSRDLSDKPASKLEQTQPVAPPQQNKV